MSTAAEATGTLPHAPSLELAGYGAAFGERVVLSRVDLELVGPGPHVLMGPAGTGKSTLLRSLAGFNDANPAFRSWGSARINGREVGSDNRPALIAQSARLVVADVLANLMHDHPERSRLAPLEQRGLAQMLLERSGMGDLGDHLDRPVLELSLLDQRRLALLRLLLPRPAVVALDEPTTGLADREATILLEHIRQESRRRRDLLVLVVLHNQQQARHLARQVALLASGVIQEQAAVEDFFSNPRSQAACQFVRTGSCDTRLPDAESVTRSDDAEVDTAAPRARAAAPETPARAGAASQAHGPNGFLWLWQGMLAGTPMPGVIQDVDYDLKALTRVGVTVLVTLTERPMPREGLAAHGLKNIWFPIPDMDAPDVADALDLCDRILALIAAGEVVAAHCLAGLGRTGTILACCLIRHGHSALSALETARMIQPKWVQSERQEQFLEEFARHCAMQPE